MHSLAAALLAYFRARDLSLHITTFVVVGLRTAPLLLVLPAQLLRSVSAPVRTGIWLALTLTASTLVHRDRATPALDWALLPALLRELIAATLSSFVVLLPMLAWEDSGRFLDTLRGDRGEGQTLAGERGGALTQLFAFLALLIVLRQSIAVHALSALVDGFQTAPPFSRTDLPTLLWMLGYLSSVMRLALLLVMPVVATLLLFEVALLSLARASSPIPLHFVAQPIRQQLVLLALLLGWPTFWMALEQFFLLFYRHG